MAAKGRAPTRKLSDGEAHKAAQEDPAAQPPSVLDELTTTLDAQGIYATEVASAEQEAQQPPVAAPAAEPAPAAHLLAGLPNDLDLPELMPPPAAPQLALAGAPPSELLAPPPRNVRWPVIIAVVLGITTFAAVVAYAELRALQAPLAPPKVAQPPPEVRAKVALAEGHAAFSAHRLEAAIAAFNRALRLDPSLTEAHRSLGIVYATQHDQARAVHHYALYLAAAPNAADAAEVQKIVDDYVASKKRSVPATGDKSPPHKKPLRHLGGAHPGKSHP